MPSFEDREGCTWNVLIDLPLARELSRVTGFDVLNLDQLGELNQSVGVQLEALWYVIRGQCEENGVTDFRSFEKRLHVEDDEEPFIADAVHAFAEALIDFFRRLGLKPQQTLEETFLEASKAIWETSQQEAYQARVKTETKGLVDQIRSAGRPDQTSGSEAITGAPPTTSEALHARQGQSSRRKRKRKRSGARS